MTLQKRFVRADQEQKCEGPFLRLDLGCVNSGPHILAPDWLLWGWTGVVPSSCRVRSVTTVDEEHFFLICAFALSGLRQPNVRATGGLRYAVLAAWSVAISKR